MPTYEYACRSCEEHLEVVQSFKDDALTTCPGCGGELRKVFSAAGIIFKGSGWHIKDYASSGSSGSGGASDSAGSSDSSGSPDSSSTDAGGSSSDASGKADTSSSTTGGASKDSSSSSSSGSSGSTERKSA